MKKVFKTIEIVGIVGYFSELSKEAQNEIPLKIRWTLKKNLDKISPIAQSFGKFRDEQLEEMKAKWFDDAHSIEIIKPKVDENGKPVMKDGVQETETSRQVKPEFVDDYRKEFDDLNAKLVEIASEENEFDIEAIDMDGFVNGLPSNTKIDFDTLMMMTFMDQTTNVKKKK